MRQTSRQRPLGQIVKKKLTPANQRRAGRSALPIHEPKGLVQTKPALKGIFDGFFTVFLYR
jgi:hypothetical protein